MKRENASNLVRTQRSDRTSARFFGLVDMLVRALEPTQTQLDALESSYQSTGEFLVAAPEFQRLRCCHRATGRVEVRPNRP